MHASRGNWITDWNLHAITAGVVAESSGLAAAAARATDLIGMRARLQAYSMAIVDANYLLAWECACALIFVALLRKEPMFYGDMSKLQQTPAAAYRKLAAKPGPVPRWLRLLHIRWEEQSKESKL